MKELPNELQSLDLEAIGSDVSSSLKICTILDWCNRSMCLCIEMFICCFRWQMLTSQKSPSQVFIWKTFSLFYFEIGLSIFLDLGIGWPLTQYLSSCRWTCMLCYSSQMHVLKIVSIIYWFVIITWSFVVLCPSYFLLCSIWLGTSSRDFDVDATFTHYNFLLKYKKPVLCFFEGCVNMKVTLGCWIVTLLVHMRNQSRKKKGSGLRDHIDI